MSCMNESILLTNYYNTCIRTNIFVSIFFIRIKSLLLISDNFALYFQLNISHRCRHISRTTSHTLPFGSSVQTPEAPSDIYFVSGSNQLIATDG